MADARERGRAYTREQLARALDLPEGVSIARVDVDHLRDLTIIVMTGGENFYYRGKYDLPEFEV